MKCEFEVKDLVVEYGAQKALNGVNFRSTNSCVTLFVGQNGAGKSSFLRCLAGLQVWQSGEIFRRGISRKEDGKDFNEDLLLISEDIILPAGDLDRLALYYSKIWPKFDFDSFKRILSYGEISTKKTASQLSKGQRILTQFALGLATKSRCILIDEVTAALDPYVRRRVSEELVDYQAEHGATVIIASNIATEFREINLQVVLFKDGKVYLEGTLADLQSEFLKIKIPLSRRGDFPLAVLLSKEKDMFAQFILRKNKGENLIGTQTEDSPITLEEIFIFLSDRRSS